MKVGWGLIHQPNSLWVRALRGKYGCGDNVLPTVKKCSRESLVWRGIRSTWDRVISGSCWRVGDGTSIQFWRDPWIMSGHVLLSLVIQPVPLSDLDTPLSEFFEVGRGWKVDRFATFLPHDTVQEIVLFHSLQSQPARDEIMWDGTPPRTSLQNQHMN